MAVLKFSNQGGFPLLEAINVASDGTNTTVSFNNHPWRQTNRFFGGFFVKITQAVTTSAEPLQFSTNGVSGSTVPVYLSNGTQATVADIVSTGPAIYMAFYDRDTNRVQLLGV